MGTQHFQTLHVLKVPPSPSNAHIHTVRSTTPKFQVNILQKMCIKRILRVYKTTTKIKCWPDLILLEMCFPFQDEADHE